MNRQRWQRASRNGFKEERAARTCDARDVATAAKADLFERKIQRHVIAQSFQPHAARPNRHVRRLGEQRGFIDIVTLGIRRQLSRAIELQANAGRPRSARSLWTHQKRQVEASVAHPAVEIQPLGPGIGAKRHIRNPVKSIQCPQRGARFGRRP